MALFAFTACSSPSSSGKAVKTGLAVISSISKSVDAGEKDGLAEIDSAIAAVIVDKNGSKKYVIISEVDHSTSLFYGWRFCEVIAKIEDA